MSWLALVLIAATPFGNQQNRKQPSPTQTHTANYCKLTPPTTIVTSQPQTPSQSQQYQQQPLRKPHKQMTAKRKNSNSNDINNTATSEAPPANTTTNTTATVTSATNARANSGTIAANNGPSPLAAVTTARRESHISTSSNGEDETDVIGELVGHFGKWQCLMTMLLSLFQVPNTFHISSPVYQVSQLTGIEVLSANFHELCNCVGFEWKCKLNANWFVFFSAQIFPLTFRCRRSIKISGAADRPICNICRWMCGAILAIRRTIAFRRTLTGAKWATIACSYR